MFCTAILRARKTKDIYQNRQDKALAEVYAYFKGAEEFSDESIEEICDMRSRKNIC